MRKKVRHCNTWEWSERHRKSASVTTSHPTAGTALFRNRIPRWDHWEPHSVINLELNLSNRNAQCPESSKCISIVYTTCLCLDCNLFWISGYTVSIRHNPWYCKSKGQITQIIIWSCYSRPKAPCWNSLGVFFQLVYISWRPKIAEFPRTEPQRKACRGYGCVLWQGVLGSVIRHILMRIQTNKGQTKRKTSQSMGSINIQILIQRSASTKTTGLGCKTKNQVDKVHDVHGFTVQLQNSPKCKWLNDLYKVCLKKAAFTMTQPSTLCLSLSSSSLPRGWPAPLAQRPSPKPRNSGSELSTKGRERPLLLDSRRVL